MATEITMTQVESSINFIIERYTKEEVDKIIEESVKQFRVRCEEKRVEMITGVTARLFEQFSTMEQELIIKIPFRKF